MASVSSLLKSAQSTQTKIQTANDAEVAYEWSQSAQTYDDYQAYSQYLNSQLSTTTDPTKQLSYTTKLSDAFSSYSSNEIQRQTQAINEGTGTIDDKMSTVSNLYNQAVALGNNNLAQNLVTTWDSLSIQKQNQATAAQAAATADTAAAGTALKNQVADTKDQLNGALNGFVQAFSQASTPQEQKANLAKINAQLPANLQVPDGTGLFDIAASYAQAIAGVYQQAIAAAPDAETLRTLQDDLNSYTSGTVVSLPGENGKTIPLTMDDVQKQIAASNVGQTMFSEVPTANGTAYVQNKIDNYQFGHDANGNVIAVPTYSLGGMNLDQKVTDLDGNAINTASGSGATYKSLLESSGFNVVSDNNGGYIIQDTTGKNRLNGASFAQVNMDQNGQLQFTDNENGIFNLAFNKNGGFSGVQKQIANPFLTQYSDSSRGTDTPYFENHPNQVGQAEGTAGLLTPQTISQFNNDVGIAKNPILNSGQITPSSLPQFSPTQVLQGASDIAAANRANSIQAAATTPAPTIAPLQAPNIAQSILASNASSNITVAKPTAPQATISTTPQKPSGTFTGVSNKAPSFNISI